MIFQKLRMNQRLGQSVKLPPTATLLPLLSWFKKRGDQGTCNCKLEHKGKSHATPAETFHVNGKDFIHPQLSMEITFPKYTSREQSKYTTKDIM